MAASNPVPQHKRSPKHLYVLGLLLMGMGAVLLLLPAPDRELRPAGAAALLLGVVLAGIHFLRRLMAEMSTDPITLEPAWRKPAHGSAGPGDPTVTARPDPAAPLSPTINDQVARAQQPVWGPEVFEHLSPQQFVAVCEALFEQGGFETRCEPLDASGAVTIWLHSRHLQRGTDSPAAVAMCRQSLGRPVGVREMRPLLELMGARQLQRGTYATSSSYSDKAREFARENSISVLDRTGLLDLIARRTPEQQRALLALTLDSH
jgi:restriction system protein